MSNISNIITLARVLLSVFVFYLLKNTDQVFLALVLTGLVFIGDYLDGFFARRYGLSSPFGAWFDIAADRFVELAYLLVFATMGLVSYWVAIVFLFRGIMVDGIRSFAQAQGLTAFGEQTMMNSRLGWWLVASPFSRFSYAACKVIAFCLVIASIDYPSLFAFWGSLFVYLSLVFCILRGLPVLIEGRRFFV